MSAPAVANAIKEPNLSEEWIRNWLKEDFSWAGLCQKGGWDNNNSNLQGQIRRLEGNLSDEELFDLGELLNVPGHGNFHVIFVPHHWPDEVLGFPISMEDLLNRQDAFWAKHSNSEFREHYGGTISGVHLSDASSQRLMASTQASFLWCNIGSQKLANSVRKSPRIFANCLMLRSVRVSGNFEASERKPSLKFEDTAFCGALEFCGFLGARELIFHRCKMEGALEITHSTIGSLTADDCDFGRIAIWDSSFQDKVLIRHCVLKSGVEWSSSVFEKDVEFIECELEELLELIRCDFLERVTFADVIWPSPKYLSASASGSSFRALATFSSQSPTPIQLFREADFQGGLGISRYSERQWRGALQTELDAFEPLIDGREDALHHAKNVESACRNVRKVAESQGDIQSEHFWHRAELIARRDRGDIHPSERVFSRLYGLVADYGLSITRPFQSLLLCVFIFSIIYAAIGVRNVAGSNLDFTTWLEGLGYSLNRTIPIGVFGAEDSSWRTGILGTGGTAHSIIVRTLATFQTIISASLIYLGVMAIRRKFKIT